jgi:hypothetical protein
MHSSGTLGSTWDRCVDILYPYIKAKDPDALHGVSPTIFEDDNLPQETEHMHVKTKRFDNEIDLLTFVNSVEDIINVQDLGDHTYVVEYLA